MKKTRYIAALALLLILVLTPSSPAETRKNKDKKYVSIVQISDMKKYNPNAVWHKVPCKHCNGTGHKVKSKYDAKHNRMIKWLEPCPYCKGKGYIGMSRK